MLWKILFFMILFIHLINFILFYDVIIPVMLGVIMFMRAQDIMKQPILFFITYINVTDVMSLGQMLLPLLFIVVIRVHGVIVETWISGVTKPWCCGLLPIHDHHNITGHELSLDNFSIVAGMTRVLPGPSKNNIN